MLNYKIDFDRICNVISSWTWGELVFGIEKSIITIKDVISYAKTILSDELEQFNLVLELSISEEDEGKTILDELLKIEKEHDIYLINNKWMFAIIYDAYINDKSSIFDVTEDVYAEFEYPEIISNLVRYMPCEDHRSMEEKLLEYLNENMNMFSE